MGRVIALATKDLRLLFRDKAGFFFTALGGLLAIAAGKPDEPKSHF